MTKGNKPELYTALSPAMLHLYDASNTIVVIIDVLRATSTIAGVLYNGASYVLPVDSVQECIQKGAILGAVTAGERNGQIADGLEHGNSPLEYSREFIENKILILTTTNGTRLLHMVLQGGAENIITGSFPNLSAVTSFLISKKQNVILACAGWKDRVNLEDTLFAGAVIERVKEHFYINCDSSEIAYALYKEAKHDVYQYLKDKKASHYLRLNSFGLEKDIQYCCTPDIAPVLPLYSEGKLKTAPLSVALEA